jgi:hypothetical protein
VINFVWINTAKKQSNLKEAKRIDKTSSENNFFIANPASCFTHFLKTGSERADFIEMNFEFGCPIAIFRDVYSKKAQ